jgi:hypothetical protein
MSNRSAKEYPELSEPLTLTVYTKSPQKWMLIDRETGQVYEGGSGYWEKLLPKNPNPSLDNPQTT